MLLRFWQRNSYYCQLDRYVLVSLCWPKQKRWRSSPSWRTPSCPSVSRPRQRAAVARKRVQPPPRPWKKPRGLEVTCPRVFSSNWACRYKILWWDQILGRNQPKQIQKLPLQIRDWIPKWFLRLIILTPCRVWEREICYLACVPACLIYPGTPKNIKPTWTEKVFVCRPIRRRLTPSGTVCIQW